MKKGDEYHRGVDMKVVSWAMIFIGGCILHVGGLHAGFGGKETALTGSVIAAGAGIVFMLLQILDFVKAK